MKLATQKVTVPRLRGNNHPSNGTVTEKKKKKISHEATWCMKNCIEANPLHFRQFLMMFLHPQPTIHKMNDIVKKHTCLLVSTRLLLCWFNRNGIGVFQLCWQHKCDPFLFQLKDGPVFVLGSIFHPNLCWMATRIV